MHTVDPFACHRVHLLLRIANRRIPRIAGLESPENCKFRVAKTQEDVNGEKLTVKKWWIFGADFFTVYAEFFTVF